MLLLVVNRSTGLRYVHVRLKETTQLRGYVYKTKVVLVSNLLNQLYLI